MSLRKRINLGMITMLALSLVAGLAVALGNRTQAAASVASPTANEAAAKQRVLENYGKLPLAFEPNQGQADKAVKYLSRGSGYTLYLTGNEAVMALRNTHKQNGFLKLKLVGANAEPPA